MSLILAVIFVVFYAQSAVILLVIHVPCFFWLHFHFIRIMYSSYAADSQMSYYPVVPLLEAVAIVCGLYGHYIIVIGVCVIVDNNFDTSVIPYLLDSLLFTAPDVFMWLNVTLCVHRVAAFFEVARFYTENFKWFAPVPVVGWIIAILASWTWGTNQNDINVYFTRHAKAVSILRALLSGICLVAYMSIIRSIKKMRSSSVSFFRMKSHLNIVYQALPITIMALGLTVMSYVLPFFLPEGLVDLSRHAQVSFMGDTLPISFLLANTSKKEQFVKSTFLKKYALFSNQPSPSSSVITVKPWSNS